MPEQDSFLESCIKYLQYSRKDIFSSTLVFKAINLIAKEVPLVIFFCPVLTFSRNFVDSLFSFPKIYPKYLMLHL